MASTGKNTKLFIRRTVRQAIAFAAVSASSIRAPAFSP
jgi:hypothetical protein